MFKRSLFLALVAVLLLSACAAPAAQPAATQAPAAAPAATEPPAAQPAATQPPAAEPTAAAPTAVPPTVDPNAPHAGADPGRQYLRPSATIP